MTTIVTDACIEVAFLKHIRHANEEATAGLKEKKRNIQRASLHFYGNHNALDRASPYGTQLEKLSTPTRPQQVGRRQKETRSPSRLLPDRRRRHTPENYPVSLDEPEPEGTDSKNSITAMELPLITTVKIIFREVRLW
ncbi:hypothetical protein NDU88_006818 [Pleurodeles waltl]|uniref:Uncharacterized protein n=1 Tax=Pleurodeles waltl TaxID=8319 RepID=A0AAV7NUH0_PLEWA|nr:hypothetical protein NDU88_006818 [Pleurodeles waltl]